MSSSRTRSIRSDSKNTKDLLMESDPLLGFVTPPPRFYNKKRHTKKHDKYQFDSKQNQGGNNLVTPSILSVAFEKYCGDALADSERESGAQFKMMEMLDYFVRVKSQLLMESTIVPKEVIKQCEELLLEMRSLELSKSDAAFIDMEKNKQITVRGPIDPNLPKCLDMNIKVFTIGQAFRSLLKCSIWRMDYFIPDDEMWFPKCYDFLYSMYHFFEDASISEHFLICADHLINDMRHKIVVLRIMDIETQKVCSGDSDKEKKWLVTQSLLWRMVRETKFQETHLTTIAKMSVNLLNDIYIRMPNQAAKYVPTIAGLFDTVMIALEFTSVPSHYHTFRETISVNTGARQYNDYALAAFITNSAIFSSLLSDQVSAFVRVFKLPTQVIGDDLTLNLFIVCTKMTLVKGSVYGTRQRAAIVMLGLINRLRPIISPGNDDYGHFKSACVSFVDRMLDITQENGDLTNTLCKLILELFGQ